MADVKKYTDEIAKAQKGRDVRDAIVNAINEVSDENNSYNKIKEEITDAQKKAEEIQKNIDENTQTAESWAHGHEGYPDREKDNAKYYAEKAEKEIMSIPGRVKQGKEDIDRYVRQKESELRGDTGNVFFAAFKVVNGRLKMYSDPTVDKVCFRRVGSRLKYRLKI